MRFTGLARHLFPATILLVACAATAPGDEAPVLGSGAAADSRTPRPDRPVGRRALLIGINDYMRLPDLRGAVNDVEMMRGILIERFAFRSEDIEIITNEAATRAGILAALDRLGQASEPDDVVYVHFSGHGSQVEDMNGDEEDGQDETLVPHDGRTADVPDITDDELAEALSQLQARTVVIVLDSCHSGTATRGLMQPRSVPPDDRLELYAPLATRAVVPLVQSEYVLMTGAAADQLALDGPVDGRLQGLFSYALARSLGNASPEVSARSVFSDLERELERIKAQLGLRSMPEPQLEGTAQRLDEPLLMGPRAPAATGTAAEESAEEPARLPWLEVQPLAEGRVRLVRGARLGAVPGSLWAIYPPEEREFTPGQAVGEAEVTALVGPDAIAALEPDDVSVVAGSRATAVAPAPTADHVPVRLSDVDAERGKRLRAAIRKLDAVEFVAAGEFARFAVEVGEGRCYVYGADGNYQIAELEVTSEEELTAALVALFARSMTASELLVIDNPATRMRLELSVTAAEDRGEAAPTPQGSVVVANTAAPIFRIRRPGEARTAQNSLQLRIRASTDCYLTLVDVDPEGAIHLLFPNALSEEKGYFANGWIPGGEDVLIPDSLAPGNRAGFHVDYAPPPGTDTLRAFCTAQESPSIALRDAIWALDDGSAPVGSAAQRRSVREGLGGVRRTLASVASRGLVVVADLPEPPSEPPASASETTAPDPSTAADWVASSITIDVTE